MEAQKKNDPACEEVLSAASCRTDGCGSSGWDGKDFSEYLWIIIQTVGECCFHEKGTGYYGTVPYSE